INLTVNPNVTVTVTPTSLSFAQVQGGSVPATQALTLASVGGTAAFTATVTQVTGGDWLDVTPTSGSANRDLTVSVKANSLPVSSTPYTARITLAFPNSATQPITVPVSLTVVNAQNLTLTPQSLSFAYQSGGALPAAQKLTVTSAGGAAQFS